MKHSVYYLGTFKKKGSLATFKPDLRKLSTIAFLLLKQLMGYLLGRAEHGHSGGKSSIKLKPF